MAPLTVLRYGRLGGELPCITCVCIWIAKFDPVKLKKELPSGGAGNAPLREALTTYERLDEVPLMVVKKTDGRSLREDVEWI